MTGATPAEIIAAETIVIFVSLILFGIILAIMFHKDGPHDP